jgi:arginase
LVVGGDHSLAIGTLAGLSDACDRLGLIWIDAHADFNTPASSPSGNIHGMALAVACGQGHRELRMIADRDPMVAEEDVYLLGTRDIDAEEAEALATSGVVHVPMAAFRAADARAVVRAACGALAARCDHVHLSFDIDVLDPGEVPASGTPVAGGLSLAEAEGVIREIGGGGCVRSAEFVEYNPTLDRGALSGKAVIRLIAALVDGKC